MEDLKQKLDNATDIYPRPLVAIIFALAMLCIGFALFLGSGVIMLMSFVLSSVLGFLTSITGFISNNYFDLTIETANGLSLIPNIDYLLGFTVGGIVLSSYIYFAYFYTSQNQYKSQWFFASVFAGTGTLAFGRFVDFYWKTMVVNTIQDSILSIINAFSVFLVILIFRSIAKETDMDTSFGDVFRNTLKEDEERRREKKEINRDIAQNNLFVTFFLFLFSNPLYVFMGLLTIIFSSYATFLIEKNITIFIELWWVYIVVVILSLSYLHSAWKGKKLIDNA